MNRFIVDEGDSLKGKESISELDTNHFQKQTLWKMILHIWQLLFVHWWEVNYSTHPREIVLFNGNANFTK